MYNYKASYLRRPFDSSGWGAPESLYRFMDCFQCFYLKKIVYLALPSPAAADTLANALLFTLNVIQSREFLGKLYF